MYDKREQDLNNIGYVLMQDAETGEARYVNTSDANVRKAYQDHYQDLEDYFTTTFTRSGAGVIKTSTNESYVKKLLAYFKAR